MDFMCDLEPFSKIRSHIIFKYKSRFIKLNKLMSVNWKFDYADLFVIQTGSKIVKNISLSIGQAGMQELLKQVQNKNMIYMT